MGKIKNKDDVAHYSMRLNLTNSEHLLIHQTMQGLNKDIHKSQNNFIIESVLRNIQNYTKEELITEDGKSKDKENEYVTQKELEKLEARVSQKIMKEVVTLLCASLATRTVATESMPLQQRTVEIEEKPSAETDETLSLLSGEWS